MARSTSKNSKYDVHPGDKSRKSYQRLLNKRLRQQTRVGVLRGTESFPVVRRQVDRLAH
jgi:hypothetical protein